MQEANSNASPIAHIRIRMAIKRCAITVAMMKLRLHCKSRGRSPALSLIFMRSLDGLLLYLPITSAYVFILSCTILLLKVSCQFRQRAYDSIVDDGWISSEALLLLDDTWLIFVERYSCFPHVSVAHVSLSVTIPTIEDRTAQMVVRMSFEPRAA